MTDDDRSTAATDGPDWPRLARELAEDGRFGASRTAAAGAPDGERAALLAALEATLRATDPAPPTPAEVERDLQRVMRRRGAPRTPAARVGVARRRWTAARWAGAAAALLVAVGVMRWYADGARIGGARRAVPEARAVLLATRVGQVDSVRLADGSLVVLGPDSRVERAGGASAGSRTVVLHGDAYFDVVHDARQPFTVLTQDAVLRDVGTSFAVRAGGVTGTVITVRSGEVAVRGRAANAEPESRLVAGDRATMRADGDVRVERGAGTDDDVAWARGRLVLRDAPASEVADAMRRWYGFTFRVDDESLLARRVTATFDRESGADAARIVAAAMGATMRLHGDTALIVPAAVDVP